MENWTINVNDQAIFYVLFAFSFLRKLKMKILIQKFESDTILSIQNMLDLSK